MSIGFLPKGTAEFLAKNPNMTLVPAIDENIVLEGNFGFTLTHRGENQISDSFYIKLIIPPGFPNTTPSVWELGARIPTAPEYHINPDNSFCLGSRLRLLKILHDTPCLQCFSESCLEPYLYAVSHKLSNGGPFLFGDLDHGREGELTDYIDLFGLKTNEQVLGAIQALAAKRRIANKKICVCGCKRRLGKCKLHLTLNQFRNIKPRSGYANMYQELGGK